MRHLTPRLNPDHLDALTLPADCSDTDRVLGRTIVIDDGAEAWDILFDLDCVLAARINHRTAGSRAVPQEHNHEQQDHSTG